MLFAVTEMYILSRSGKLNAEAMDDHFPMLYGALAFIFIIVLMFFL